MDLPSKLSFINFMKDKNKGSAPQIVLHVLSFEAVPTKSLFRNFLQPKEPGIFPKK
ncbi:hypothetical protein HMPREF3213_02059 [Heyndrickxia coagulans]|uniref:Uncharacterized protein n=1 Tax=Heyndrickxia coagulans TaxID=1398 RepID=A0A133KND3_HEYCO|nr:hypothetical protein HMPREF3213_02059 [Heyndrickxia coagulans]